MADDLIQPAVRSAIREVASACSTVRRIARAFRDEGFAPASADLAPTPGDDGSWYWPGERRGTFDEHAASVDWSDFRHVTRALRVFEALIDEAGNDPLESTWKVLARHNVERDDAGRLTLTGRVIAAEVSVDTLDNPEAVLEQLERLQRSGTHNDPPAAVSAAKALVEAACKQVLRQLGEAVDDKIKMHKLIERTHQALAISADSIPSSADRRQTTVNILNNLAHIPIGLAELRNTYGPDHGRLARTIGLHQRHADLAVGSAVTYVNFLLATLDERTSRRS